MESPRRNAEPPPRNTEPPYIKTFPKSYNLINKVIISFATSEKLQRDFNRKEINTWNPFYLLFKLFFYLSGAKYVHCEISFQKKDVTSKLISFTSIAQKGVVAMERDYDDYYEHIELAIGGDKKKAMYKFLCSKKDYDFDRLGSMMMPYWSGPWNNGSNGWFCISLVIEALNKGGLLPNIRPNCYTVDELYEIICAHDARGTFVRPKLLRGTKVIVEG